MKYYIELPDGRQVRKGDELTWDVGNTDEPDAEVRFINPVDNIVTIKLLTGKIGPEGMTIDVPITLFGKDSKIFEDLGGNNNPNSMFKAWKNNT